MANPKWANHICQWQTPADIRSQERFLDKLYADWSAVFGQHYMDLVLCNGECVPDDVLRAELEIWRMCRG